MINHISIPQYLLESSFCLIVFYLFYVLLLKKETYFQFNRLYLIGTAFMALLIPIINIDYSSASQFTGADTMYPIISQMNELQIGFQKTIAQESNILHISIADIINWIYMAGFFVMTLKLLSGLFKLFGIINNSPKLKDQDHTLLISEEVPAASFFSYIFWNDKHDKSDPIQKTIMDHELVHVRQWHSLDVIIIEIMVIIKWFNPLIYLFRNSLKKTHEFIADKYVTDQMGDKMKYASILLANSGRTDTPPISNHFYGNIKERIKMLSSKKSARIQQIKYIAILPITFVLLSLFSFDLTDRLPQPIKSSFQNIENSMLSMIEKSVISLDMDEDIENAAFHLNWNDLMKIKVNQTNEMQDFLFYYSKSDLNKLLAEKPSISQNGKELSIQFDTLEVVTQSGRKVIDLDDLQDEKFRAFLIDSLVKHDQLMLGMKTFSETDSLYIKLHIGLNGETFQKVVFNAEAENRVLKWGQRKIKFDEKYYIDGHKLSMDESVTDEELSHMLDSKLEVNINSIEFRPLPDDMLISFKVSRANNSNLASINAKSLEKLKNEKGLGDDVVFITSYYHGKK